MWLIDYWHMRMQSGRHVHMHKMHTYMVCLYIYIHIYIYIYVSSHTHVHEDDACHYSVIRVFMVAEISLYTFYS